MIGATGETGVPVLPSMDAACNSIVIISVLDMFLSYKTRPINKKGMKYEEFNFYFNLVAMTSTN